ncbi:MAG: hypothetical protein ACKO3W_04595 [bacterium]
MRDRDDVNFTAIEARITRAMRRVRRSRGFLRCLPAGAALGLAILLTSTDGSITASASAASAQTARPSTNRWSERLEALDPMRPLDYLVLAEEVADAAASEGERQLARELFGLAGALDTERLGRSALLALAQFSTDRRERDRALAAAEIVGGRGGALRVFRAEPEQIEALSRAFSFYRRGEGRKAINVLRQADADAVLDELDDAIPGGANGFRAALDAMKSGGGSRPDPETVRRLLLVELALRRGDARSISLDLILRGDEPLIEIDPNDPAALWQVDPAKPWWRNGRWSGSV